MRSTRRPSKQRYIAFSFDGTFQLMLLPVRKFGLCFDSRRHHDPTAISDLSLWIVTMNVSVVDDAAIRQLLFVETTVCWE
jgi:hypothetical protein